MTTFCWRRGFSIALGLVFLFAGAPLVASCSTTPSSSTILQSPGVFNLADSSRMQKMEALATVARLSPVKVFYLGESYDGMALFQIHQPPPPAATGPYAARIRYQTEAGDRFIEVIAYTPHQYAEYNVFPDGEVVKRVPNGLGLTEAIVQSGLPVRTRLVGRDAEVVVQVWGDPDLGVDAMADVADHLVPVSLSGSADLQSREQAAGSPTGGTTDRMMASWDPAILTLASQTGLADVVVVGEVVSVDPARWNSPDGAEWKPTDEGSGALVYTTSPVSAQQDRAHRDGRQETSPPGG